LIYPILEARDSKQAIDDTYYTNWTRNSIGGFDFVDFRPAEGVLKFAVYYNFTVNGGGDLPTLINFVSNAAWKYFFGGTAQSQLANAGRMGFPQNKIRNTLDIISLGGPSLYIYLFQFMLAPVMQTLVSEKESKLREIMKMVRFYVEDTVMIAVILEIIVSTNSYSYLCCLCSFFV
jgi:hypothetical protein